MKIIIISFDEPFFIPYLFRPLIEKFSKNIKAVIIVPPKHPKKSRINFLFEQLLLTSFPRFFTRGADYLKELLLTKLGFSDKSIAALARKYKIKVVTTGSVNDQKTKEYLKRVKPDIILTQVPEIIDESLLVLAKKGFINKHASILPKYKGLYPIFWALVKGEKQVGYTFHLMNNNIDSGDILFQRIIKVSKGDSLSGLYQKVFKLAGIDLPRIVENFDENRLKIRKMPKVSNNYYSIPKRKDIQIFQKLGYKLK